MAGFFYVSPPDAQSTQGGDRKSKPKLSVLKNMAEAVLHWRNGTEEQAPSWTLATTPRKRSQINATPFERLGMVEGQKLPIGFYCRNGWGWWNGYPVQFFSLDDIYTSECIHIERIWHRKTLKMAKLPNCCNRIRS